MTRSRALVLGGTGYVGEAVVRGFAGAGLAAAFTYHRSADRARALASEFGVRGYPMDLGDGADIRRALYAIQAAEGVPDVLVSCAACADTSQVMDIDDALFSRVMQVNVNGVFTCVREFSRRLLAAGDESAGSAESAGSQLGRGDIVLVAGPDAAMATPSAVHFAASQQALVGLARAAAAELGPRGIRINVLAVGVLDGGAGHFLAAERRAQVERYSALGRIGDADEVARAIVWLALENPHLCGVVVPVTGGL